MDIKSHRFILLFFALLIPLSYSVGYYDALRKKFAKYVAPPICPRVVCSTDELDFCSTVTNNSLILCPTCCSLSIFTIRHSKRG